MDLIEIQDQEKYNNFIASHKQAQFLESWEWGEFQKDVGNKINRVGLFYNKELLFCCTLIEKSLPLGMKYWYAPRINLKIQIKNYELFFKKLRKFAEENNIIFFRFDPIDDLSKAHCQKLIVKTIHVQPEKTLILDISKSEDELLTEMHSKTRYNIRLAGKKGLKVGKASDQDFEDWWQIMKETCQRDKFRLHNKEYYKKQLSINDGQLSINLLVAKYKGEIIAGNIVAFFSDMATYVHGASGDKYRNLMAPYALQWHSIQEAKKRGCNYYDLYGIDEEKWPGVTRFKKGFGGEAVNYPGTFDLIFDKKQYYIYKLLRAIRRVF